MGTDSSLRVGVYVDSENITRNGGDKIRYDSLREFACRQGGIPIRLNTYIAFDEEKGTDAYKAHAATYHAAVRNSGFKVITKIVKWYKDKAGNSISKANADLDMAVDALLESENLDRVVLATGDGDFVKVVRALQGKGCRVEIIAFDNVSSDLRREADLFFPGYLVPRLIPTTKKQQNSGKVPRWGEVGSRVKGVCYSYPHSGTIGFFRVLMNQDGDVLLYDNRKDGSPYVGVAFIPQNMPTSVSVDELPSRDHIFEFTLESGDKKGQWRASDIELIQRYSAL